MLLSFNSHSQTTVINFLLGLIQMGDVPSYLKADTMRLMAKLIKHPMVQKEQQLLFVNYALQFLYADDLSLAT